MKIVYIMCTYFVNDVVTPIVSWIFLEHFLHVAIHFFPQVWKLAYANRITRGTEIPLSALKVELPGFTSSSELASVSAIFVKTTQSLSLVLISNNDFVDFSSPLSESDNSFNKKNGGQKGKTDNY